MRCPNAMRLLRQYPHPRRLCRNKGEAMTSGTNRNFDPNMSFRSGDAIRQVCVVATGYVGSGWVGFFLSRGLRVSVYARRAASEARLSADLDAMWPDLERVGLTPDADRRAMTFHTDLNAALEGSDFVQENTAEDLDLKTQLYAEIDARLPGDILIASSTSSLPISSIQALCRQPSRCILGHPFTPTHLMRLVEVGGGKSTDPRAVTAALETYRHWGKRPVRLNTEVFGHIANRLASALWREAVHLAAEGVASVEDIDTAVVEGLGRKWAVSGPFLSYHLSGGDGGIAHFFKSYSAGIQRRWDDLGRPALTDDLKHRLTQMVLEEVGGRSREALEADRAHQIASLMTSLAGK